MFSIQQMINNLRRLQLTNNGHVLPTIGRNEIFENFKYAIDVYVTQAGQQQGAITQQRTVAATTAKVIKTILMTSPSSSLITKTTTTNNFNKQQLNGRIKRELRELQIKIQTSSLSSSLLTSLSSLLSTLVMALTTTTFINGSAKSKFLLSKHFLNCSSSSNNSINNSSSSSSSSSIINDCSSQLAGKSRPMAINEIQATTTATILAVEIEPTASTIREIPAVALAVADNEINGDCVVQPFSNYLYVCGNGTIYLNHHHSQENRTEKKFHQNYSNLTQKRNDELEAEKKSDVKNFIKENYQNNRQQFQVATATTEIITTTTTATTAAEATTRATNTKTAAITFNQSVQNFYQYQPLHQQYRKQQQQQQQQHRRRQHIYQKQYFHTKNSNSMDNNQNFNMNDEQQQQQRQQQQNSNELFKVMADRPSGRQQQRTLDYKMTAGAAALLCNNFENSTTTTKKTKTITTISPSPSVLGSAAITTTSHAPTSTSGVSCQEHHNATGKPCFNTGLNDILKFMELIGNLKHTKRTGWVLRDVNDCESISGHMYRMSILTFLLDGTEGLNQTRCMELALVHDLAESLVGDITPFCGVSKVDKRAMEFKAMEDICKLIEPRGKRIMELFEEYELGESAESQFVKDLDRLDMVMQAFEYEKRDNCLLKHQEFFDSTAGKFKHPFVRKLVNEIYEQRNKLAKAKGAILPPKIDVPNMELQVTTRNNSSNGHYNSTTTTSTTPTIPTTTTTTTTTTIGSTSNSNKS